MNNKESLLENIVNYIIYNKNVKSLTNEDIEVIRKEVLTILEQSVSTNTKEVKLYSAYGNIPEYKTVGAACMDITAVIDNKTFNHDNNKCIWTTVNINDKGIPFINIAPGGRCIINTGLYCEVPEGYKLTVKPRSGESIKSGLYVHPGTIDSDYRGEIGIIVSNNTTENIYIHNGDRIAQLELEKVDKVKWKLVASRSLLSETDRGEGGYGHTGK